MAGTLSQHLWENGAIPDLLTLAQILGVLLVGRVLWVSVYRLWFSPLAKFPGPKLAALTTLYEFYYDLISKGGGQMTFQVKRLHEQYGPIVRVGPNEVHIDDPDFYNTVYTKHTAQRPIDKLERYRHRFGMPEATISTVSGELHRIRRAAIAPFFSRQRIAALEGTVQDIMNIISHRLATEYAGTGRNIDVCTMWGSMTADVVSELAFARCANFTSAPGFFSPYYEALRSMVYAGHITTHMNWLMGMIHWVPDAVMGRLIPGFKPILDYRVLIRKQVRDVFAGKNMDAKDASHATVFHDILASDLPPEELTIERVTQEAMSVSGAGIETTMWTLSIATFHVLWNPDVERRLVAELTEAMPDPSEILPWAQLEKLPYLSAVITESLRLSMGSVQRLPRVSRLDSIQYGEWTIPAGSAVSMDAYHMHYNPELFPEPDKFLPERWLGDPRDPRKGPGEDAHPLSYFMVSFIRGSRVCVGMHLAMMDLYIALATLFRRHKLELFETDRSDVDFLVDLVRPMPKWGSKGVRITVKS